MTMYGEMESDETRKKREMRKGEWVFRGVAMGPLALDTGGRSGICWSRGIKETISQEINCQDLVWVWVWTLWDNLIKCYCSARNWEAGFHEGTTLLGSYFVITVRVD
jgi:hypothetical protein